MVPGACLRHAVAACTPADAGALFVGQAYHSPFITPSHVAWRKKMRAFTEREVMPFVHQWDEDKKIPAEFYKKAAKAGILAAAVGEWPTKYSGEGPEGFNAFHGAIMVDELCRCASGGLVWCVPAQSRSRLGCVC